MLRQLISTSGAGSTAALCDILLAELERGAVVLHEVFVAIFLDKARREIYQPRRER